MISDEQDEQLEDLLRLLPQMSSDWEPPDGRPWSRSELLRQAIEVGLAELARRHGLADYGDDYGDDGGGGPII
jgi:hypothetical protein